MKMRCLPDRHIYLTILPFNKLCQGFSDRRQRLDKKVVKLIGLTRQNKGINSENSLKYNLAENMEHFEDLDMSVWSIIQQLTK